MFGGSLCTISAVVILTSPQTGRASLTIGSTFSGAAGAAAGFGASAASAAVASRAVASVRMSFMLVGNGIMLSPYFVMELLALGSWFSGSRSSRELRADSRELLRDPLDFREHPHEVLPHDLADVAL